MIKKLLFICIALAFAMVSPLASAQECARCVNAIDQKLDPRFKGVEKKLDDLQISVNKLLGRTSFFVLDLEQLKTGADTLSTSQLDLDCGSLSGASTGIFQCKAKKTNTFNCEGATGNKSVTIAAYVVSGPGRVRGLICENK